MTAGVGNLGSDIELTYGGSTLVGIITKDVTLSNAPLDVTDDQSGGHRELMAQSGLQTLDLTLSGPLKNLELMEMFYNGVSKMAAAQITYADGSTLAFDAVLTEFSHSGDSNDPTTFSASIQSSGAPTFTAAT